MGINKNITVLFLLFLCSCSRKHIQVQYRSDSTNTGTIILKPVKKTIKTYVSIDDSLIVEKRRVKSITITNVPVGMQKVQYSSDNSWYKYSMDSTFTIKIEASKTSTKVVKNPPYSTGYYIYQSAWFLGTVLLLIFLQ